MSKSKFYHINASGNLTSVATVEEAYTLSKTGGFIWLSYCEPTLEELSLLTKPFMLHPLSIEDCIDKNQIPKIEEFPGNTFILFNDFNYTNKVLTIEEVNLFIGADFLVLINRHGLDEKKLLDNIEKIATKNIDKRK